MISQSGHLAATSFSKLGRSWDSYRAVFDSGSSSAILPPPPPLPPVSPPPPVFVLLSSSPHAASASEATRAKTASSAVTFHRLSMSPPQGCLRCPTHAGRPCLPKHQCHRAEQLRPVAEAALHDLHVLGGARAGAQIHCLPHRGEQQISDGVPHAPSDHDALWVEQVADVREHDADVAAG